MPIPAVNLTIEDGALGQSQSASGDRIAVVGVCAWGMPGDANAYSAPSTMTAATGKGPAAEAAALILDEGGKVLFVPVEPVTAGTAGSVTHVGTGVGTVAAGFGPDREIVVKVSTAGALETAAFQFKVGGGEYSAPVVSTSPFVYRVPGTLTKLTFPAGSYVEAETYTVATTGVITKSSTGPTVTQASSPLDSYEAKIEVTTTGTLGTAAFRYSLDDGDTWSADIAVPGGAGKYAIAGSGVVLTFAGDAGAFVDGDTYDFDTVAAGYTTTELNTALDTLGASAAEFDGALIVGMPANAAAAATVASAVNTKVQGWATTRKRFKWAMVECPETEADSAIASAFAAFSSATGRVIVGCGNLQMRSPLTGRAQWRCVTWAAAARAASKPFERSLAYVKDGPLSNAIDIDRDEAVSEYLNDQRFMTCRTHVGKVGYYITRDVTMAPGGSDYAFLPEVRNINEACRRAYAKAVEMLSGEVAVKKDTGTISEVEAARLESDINGELSVGLVDPGHVVDANVVVGRDANLRSGAALPITVRILPYSYTDFIDLSIGLTNPALQ